MSDNANYNRQQEFLRDSRLIDEDKDLLIEGFAYANGKPVGEGDAA